MSIQSFFADNWKSIRNTGIGLAMAGGFMIAQPGTEGPTLNNPDSKDAKQEQQNGAIALGAGVAALAIAAVSKPKKKDGNTPS